MFDSNSLWVGIDVSKSYVDVCVLGGDQPRTERYEQQAEDLEQMAASLAGKAVVRVVLEASGGYERVVVAHLQAAGLPVAVVNPRQARHYAKAVGLLAKTDRLDAQMLARLGRDLKTRVTPVIDSERQQLIDLVQRQQQLVRLRASERNRLQRAAGPECIDSCRRVIEALSDEVDRINAEIQRRIASNESWKQRERLLRSAPGVGPKTAATLLAQFPELGGLDAKRIASLAGLAPFACDSGRFRGQRRIAGGRKLVRQMLYMAARTAVVRDLGWRCFYQSMLARGKRPQLALIAVARKLLVALNAMARDQSVWEPHFLSEISS